MIVLESIDLQARRASYRSLDDGDDTWRAEFSRASTLARSLGLDDVRLHVGMPTADAGSGAAEHASLPAPESRAVPRSADASRTPPHVRHARPHGRAEATPQSQTALADDPDEEQAVVVAPRHHWLLTAEGLRYETVFVHSSASAELVGLWMALALVTFGPQEDGLLQLRTCIYEICANIFEHGRPLSETGTVTVTLQFLPNRVEGSVQDGCEPFDSSRQPLQSVLERAGARHRRGYGMHMMQRMLDRLEHEYNHAGNRLVFTKKVLP
jgi:anti-sigma regulatory factor (Ser/Thr protein kinase)